MLRVALVGDSDRGDFKLQVVRRILGALDVGTLGAIREHAAVPATAVRNVFVGFRTLVCKRWLLFTGQPCIYYTRVSSATAVYS